MILEILAGPCLGILKDFTLISLIWYVVYIIACNKHQDLYELVENQLCFNNKVREHHSCCN